MTVTLPITSACRSAFLFSLLSEFLSNSEVLFSWASTPVTFHGHYLRLSFRRWGHPLSSCPHWLLHQNFHKKALHDNEVWPHFETVWMWRMIIYMEKAHILALSSLLTNLWGVRLCLASSGAGAAVWDGAPLAGGAEDDPQAAAGRAERGAELQTRRSQRRGRLSGNLTFYLLLCMFKTTYYPHTVIHNSVNLENYDILITLK